MPKKRKRAATSGRDEEIQDATLRDRYSALKQFFEYNWGRIRPTLMQARKPEDVRLAFRLVPTVEWCPPFRDHKASCLINPGSGPVEVNELRTTQRTHDEATKSLNRLWLEFHKISP